MPQTEFPPQNFEQQEALSQLNHAPIGEHIGGVALQIEGKEAPTDAYVKEGIAQLEAHLETAANSQDVRAEDAGRIHDIDEAHQAAKHENDIFDLYEDAKLQNKIHTAMAMP